MKIEILRDEKKIDQIVDIHLNTFRGFFLTFLGKGFLKTLYKGFLKCDNSNIIVAIDNDTILGFLAYSFDISSFYKYLLKTKFLNFMWYSILAFFRKPLVLFRLIRALTYPKNTKSSDKYIELSSIGVSYDKKRLGIGTSLIEFLKFNIFKQHEDVSYIKLETDAIGNDYANDFYLKNGFILFETYETKEKRKMNEYRLYHECKKGDYNEDCSTM